MFLGVVDQTDEGIKTRTYILVNAKPTGILLLLEALKFGGKSLDDVYKFSFELFRRDLSYTAPVFADFLTIPAKQRYSVPMHDVIRNLRLHKTARLDEDFHKKGITAVTLPLVEKQLAGQQARSLNSESLGFEYLLSDMKKTSWKVTVTGTQTVLINSLIPSETEFPTAMGEYVHFQFTIPHPQTAFVGVIADTVESSITLIFVGMKADDVLKLTKAYRSLPAKFDYNVVFRYFEAAFGGNRFSDPHICGVYTIKDEIKFFISTKFELWNVNMELVQTMIETVQISLPNGAGFQLKPYYHATTAENNKKTEITFDKWALSHSNSPFIGTITKDGKDLVYIFLLTDRHTDRSAAIAAGEAAFDIPAEYREREEQHSEKKLKYVMDYFYAYQVAQKADNTANVLIVDLIYRGDFQFSTPEKYKQRQRGLLLKDTYFQYVIESGGTMEFLWIVEVLQSVRTYSNKLLTRVFENLNALDERERFIAVEHLRLVTTSELSLYYNSRSPRNILPVIENLKAHKAARGDKNFDNLGITVVTLTGSHDSSLGNQPFRFTYGVSSIEDDTRWQVTVSEKKVVQITNLQPDSTMFPELMGEFQKSILTIKNPSNPFIGVVGYTDDKLSLIFVGMKAEDILKLTKVRESLAGNYSLEKVFETLENAFGGRRCWRINKFLAGIKRGSSPKP